MTTPAIEELEKRASELQGICNRLSGHPSYEKSRMRYAGCLLEVARHRPLSVYELMNCGMDYPEAVRVANATGGERTDVPAGADPKLYGRMPCPKPSPAPCATETSRTTNLTK